MAKADYKKEFDKLLEEARKQIKQGFFLEEGTILTFTVRGAEFIRAYKQAARTIIKASNPAWRIYNTDESWKEALLETAKDVPSLTFIYWGKPQPKGASYIQLSKDMLGTTVAFKPGMYIVQNNGQVLEIDFVASTIDGSLQEEYATQAISFIKDTIWDNWVEIVRQKSGLGSKFLGFSYERGKRYSRSKGAVYSDTYGKLLTDAGVKAAHKESSTKGVKALEILRHNNPTISIKGVEFKVSDFVDHFMEGIKLTARNKRFERKTGGVKLPGQNHLIEVRIATNKREKTDIPNIKLAAEEYIAKWVIQKVEEGKILKVDGRTSKPYSQDLQDAAILAIANKFKPKKTKTIKITKNIKATKTNPFEYEINVGKGTNSYKGRTKRKSLSLKGVAKTLPVSRRSREQSGKLQKGVTLPQLKSYINRGLHNELQRNMGRPALNYVTGQFARSAYLQSLRPSKTNLIGEYTYQLDPYQTFENTGQKKWPIGYNPKPLIARSIRNLAARHVENKFTLRRV